MLNHPIVLFLAGAALLAVPYVGWRLAFVYISGWHRAARRYRAQGPFVGERFSELSVGMRCASSWWSMRGVEYGDELTIGANQAGLHLSAPLHPPLLIPWGNVTFSEEVVKPPILGSEARTYRIGFRDEPGVELVNVSVDLASRLRQVAGRAWPAA